MGAEPQIRAFFDEPTNTVSYLVWDPGSRRGVAIDPVLDFDVAAGTVDDGSVEELLDVARNEGVAIEWVLETHIHADHLSGAPLIKSRTGAPIAIGEHVREVQNIFRPIFGAEDVKAEGGDFDRLLRDGERLAVGGLGIEVMHTPGHTPACVSYRIGDAVFVGDTLFMPDYGTARTDFPGGCARQLYRSIRKLLSLPPETRLFMCHDYKAPGRDTFAWETTVAEERRSNRHIHEGVGEDEFVTMRQERDRSLCTPRLLIPSIQVNMRAGRFPPADSHGVRYLRVPVTLKQGASPEAIC
ncbi:MAG TPA: MBL fold metallo-hydrolase [Sphingomicrobium sp.]|nr:MBL fold metallo-hydrolase [Sphingomicrobium sp.]